MLKPQRLLARHPLHESSKQRLRALKPRDRARIKPRRAALLAAHGPLITIHTFRRRFAHRAVTVPGRGEQVEQIRSHAITSVSRWERDITRLSPPLTRTPSEITANNPARSASERTNCQRNWAIYPLQTTCTRDIQRLVDRLARHPHLRIGGEPQPQPRRDLGRRVLARQVLLDDRAQRQVDGELGRLGTPGALPRQRMRTAGAILPTRVGVTTQLARDR